MISRPRQHRNDAEAVAKKKNNPAEAMGTHIITISSSSSSSSRSKVRSVGVGNVPSTHMSGHHKLKHRRECTHEHVHRHR